LHHYKRLSSYLDEKNHKGKYLLKGQQDEKKLAIMPTVIESPHPDSFLMKEEIFGPILPIFTYQDSSEIDSIVSHHPNPLSFYVFSEDNQFTEELTSRHSFGGGCINNTVMHLVDPQLPFGGIGYSGSGAYHGKWGFDALSHKKSIVKTASWFDLKQKYPPYTQNSLKIIKWFLK
jgi:aldehyde dehydrogenase (NAD+)